MVQSTDVVAWACSWRRLSTEVELLHQAERTDTEQHSLKNEQVVLACSAEVVGPEDRDGCFGDQLGRMAHLDEHLEDRNRR